jgi:hypothetical protein
MPGFDNILIEHPVADTVVKPQFSRDDRCISVANIVLKTHILGFSVQISDVSDTGVGHLKKEDLIDEFCGGCEAV